MIKVIIADDHAMFREGLSVLLRDSNEIELVGEASDGIGALDLILRKLPDVACIDILMPEKDGLQVYRELRRKKVSTKIVLLTGVKDIITAHRAIKEGVEGYLLKDDAFHSLVSAIKAVYKGQRYISPTVAGEIFNSFSRFKTGDVRLSPREIEIISLVAKGYTNKDISRILNISVRTVETHRARIMQKLGLKGTADLVMFAIKSGLISL